MDSPYWIGQECDKQVNIYPIHKIPSNSFQDRLLAVQIACCSLVALQAIYY